MYLGLALHHSSVHSLRWLERIVQVLCWCRICQSCTDRSDRWYLACPSFKQIWPWPRGAPWYKGWHACLGPSPWAESNDCDSRQMLSCTVVPFLLRAQDRVQQELLRVAIQRHHTSYRVRSLITSCRLQMDLASLVTYLTIWRKISFSATGSKLHGKCPRCVLYWLAPTSYSDVGHHSVKGGVYSHQAKDQRANISITVHRRKVRRLGWINQVYFQSHTNLVRT
jgi:hypothetical protein